MQKRILESPIFLILLPVFFVLHGFYENLGIVFVPDAVRLVAWYLLASLILFGVSWLIFRHGGKAAIFSFGLLAFNFFFGAVHDALKSISFLPFISRYVIVLPASLTLLIIFFIWVKRSKRNFLRTSRYLNILLMVLVLMDLVLLASKSFSSDKPESTAALPLKSCANCSNPDIYLVLCDGYPSNVQFREQLNFDNSSFLNALKQRGFYVADNSMGNYNMTPISMASMLDMNYMAGIGGTSATHKKDVAEALQLIRRASFPRYLRSQGYQIHNFSIFDLEKEMAVAEPTFLPTRTSNITAQTFLMRILKDLGFHLIDKFHIRFVIRISREADLRNNNKLLNKTRGVISESKKPKFVYTHLMMPHYPYYFDSTGKQRPLEALTTKLITDTSAFVSYVKYANRELLNLVDQIRRESVRPPVIILASDHGFRNFEYDVEHRYHFMNLITVYYPGKNYGSFYPAISNINLFRTVLNDQFGQRLPLLRDSTSFLLEK